MNNLMTISGVAGYLDESGTAYLRLEDVARGLGFSRVAASGNEVIRWETVRKYLSDFSVPTSWHGNFPEVGKEGLPDFIPENIFYRLAMKAKNETAEKFQALVADEILPSIRKTGGYVTNDNLFIDTYLPFADENTKALFRLQLTVNRENNAIIEKQRRQIEEQKPAVEFTETVLKSCENILMRDMAKLLCNEGVNIGEKRLYKLLRQNGILMEDNIPYQSFVDQGYFVVKEGAYHTPYGTVKLNTTTMVTPRGQVWLVSKVRKLLKVGETNK